MYIKNNSDIWATDIWRSKTQLLGVLLLMALAILDGAFNAEWLRGIGVLMCAVGWSLLVDLRGWRLGLAIAVCTFVQMDTFLSLKLSFGGVCMAGVVAVLLRYYSPRAKSIFFWVTWFAGIRIVDAVVSNTAGVVASIVWSLVWFSLGPQLLGPQSTTQSEQ